MKEGVIQYDSNWIVFYNTLLFYVTLELTNEFFVADLVQDIFKFSYLKVTENAKPTIC